MTWWMIVLLVLAIFFLLGCVPAGADVSWRGGVFTLRAKLGPFRMTLVPAKEKKRKKKTAKKAESESTTQSPKPKLAFSGGVSEIMELLEFALNVLGDLRRKLRVEQLTLHVRFGAGDDAAKTAIAYGRAWAAIGALLPCLERLFVIGKRDLGAELDYACGEKMTVDARLVITITIGRALALALRAGVRFLKIYKNWNKGGVQNEPSSE